MMIFTTLLCGLFLCRFYTSTHDIRCPSRVTEEIAIEGEKSPDAKKPFREEDARDGKKDRTENESEEKELENKVDVFF